MIFISSQIGNEPISGQLVLSGIEAETTQVMQNINSILGAEKADFSNVVKTSVYLTKIEDLETVNRIYSTFFTGTFPALEVIEASALEQNAHVAISMIAINS